MHDHAEVRPAGAVEVTLVLTDRLHATQGFGSTSRRPRGRIAWRGGHPSVESRFCRLARPLKATRPTLRDLMTTPHQPNPKANPLSARLYTLPTVHEIAPIASVLCDGRARAPRVKPGVAAPHRTAGARARLGTAVEPLRTKGRS